MSNLVYEVQPELEIETIWVCSIKGCTSCCFDAEFAERMGCAKHGFTWVREVRQFENGKLISEFREQP